MVIWMRLWTAAACLILAGCAPTMGAAGDRATSGPVSAPPGGTPVAGVGAPGPRAAGTTQRMTVSCPGGQPAHGGGVLADVSSGPAPSPTLRLDASAPDGEGGWYATVAVGGQSESAARTRVFAVCSASVGPIQEVTATVPGPESAGSARTATASCPRGLVAVAGGGQVDLAGGRSAPRHFFLIGTYPSTPTGMPVAHGVAGAWSAEGAIGGMPLTGGRVRAVALCGAPSGMLIVADSARGPTAPAAAALAVATCPSGASLVSGGALTGLPARGVPPQGLHLRGSFPSDATGQAPSGGGVAGSWSAVANNGGLASLGASTTAFALCARRSGGAP